MKKVFNQLVAGVLSETDTCTTGASGMFIHYVQALPGEQLSLFDDWITQLISNGFVLRHEKKSKMQDIFLTSEELLCKVTSVHGYINVMFFDSITKLHEDTQKTLALINQIYN